MLFRHEIVLVSSGQGFVRYASNMTGVNGTLFVALTALEKVHLNESLHAMLAAL